jgi:hypothetical protein
VKKELFAYNSAVLEEDMSNVGMEWETTGQFRPLRGFHPVFSIL